MTYRIRETVFTIQPVKFFFWEIFSYTVEKGEIEVVLKFPVTVIVQ